MLYFRAMKTCSSCKKEKAEEEFNWKIKEGRRQTYCRECQHVHARQHYQLNKGRYRERAAENNRKYLAAARKLLREKKSVPCSDCGRSYAYWVMDLDHVRGKKIREVGRMVAQRASLDVVAKEIAKCDVVCSNCHRERTHRRRSGVVQRKDARL